MEIIEYTKEQAQSIANALSKKSEGGMYFYFNVYGWQTYFTTEPTFATPTGKATGFPRQVFFKKKSVTP